MQGKLRKEKLDFTIKSQCAQSGRPMNIVIDSDLQIKKIDKGSNPYVFAPKPDIENTKELSIIEIF